MLRKMWKAPKMLNVDMKKKPMFLRSWKQRIIFFVAATENFFWHYQYKKGIDKHLNPCSGPAALPTPEIFLDKLLHHD